MVAAEDRNFYPEGGISLPGIVRSAYDGRQGRQRGLQGGSTITEQFAKNYYATIGTSRTVSTKIKEIFVSIKLSHEKSKDWIMTQYLNTMLFGNNAYGVGRGRRDLLRQARLKLNIAQAAMLAAMVNQPGFFRPEPGAAGYTAAGGPLALRAGQHGQGRCHHPAAGGHHHAPPNDASGFPKLAKGVRNSGWTGYRGYIMQTVENELETTYGFTKPQIVTRGLKIVTTFSMPMMKALTSRCGRTSRRCGMAACHCPGSPISGALLEQPGTGEIVAMYGGPDYAKRSAEHGDAEPGPGRILVQALRAGHRGQGGHERQDQRPERLSADLRAARQFPDGPNALSTRPPRARPARRTAGSTSPAARTAVRSA